MSMGPAPMVSIIMNCFNGDTYLREAIDSVYAQSYKNWEIIFWDNASTDQSGEIAKSYDGRLKYHRAEKTAPLGEARNLAMQEAAGKFIAFLDCDDLYLSEKLEKQVRLMEEGGYGMSYGSAIIIDEGGNEIRRAPARNQSGFIFGALLKRNEINMQSVMLRRDMLEKEQLSFATHLQYCPDHNLFMEIASRQEVGVLKDYVVKYRIAKGSLSRKTLHLVSSEVKYTLDRIFDRNPELKETYRDSVKIAYAKLHYYDAVNLINQGGLGAARLVLRPIVFQQWEYLALYLLLFLPLPSDFILRLLRR